MLLLLKPGDSRADNKWLHYERSEISNSQQEMEGHVYVDNSYAGYQTWPTDLKIYSTGKNGFSYLQHEESRNAYDKIILDAFLNPQYVESFVKYFSTEKLSKFIFSPSKLQDLFKRLFRNYGPIVFHPFKTSLEDLLSRENRKLCKEKLYLAPELVGGLIHGCKHWDFKALKEMWDFLIPLLREFQQQPNTEDEHCLWTFSLNYATVNFKF